MFGRDWVFLFANMGRKFVLLLLISFVLSLIDMGQGTLPNYERIL